MRARVLVLVGVAALGGAIWVGSRPRATRPAGPATNPLVAARPYRVAVPTASPPASGRPLVIVLHGLGGNGERIERYYQLDRLVDELGFLVAYPEGTEEPRQGHFWTARRRFWNATNACCNFFGSKVDDVAYLDAVIDDLGARYAVDPRRIFIVGLSNGGYMAHRYACDRAGRVAAIVSQAGAMWMDTSRCQPSEPVAVLQIHGTEDHLVPYDGLPPGLAAENRFPSAHQTVADWVVFDKCDPTPDTSTPPLDLIENGTSPDVPAAETTVEKWGNCRGVELWTMRGGRHVPRIHHPAGDRLIYNWLAAHPKP